MRASQEIIRRIKVLKETNPQAYADKISTLKNTLQELKSHGLTSKDFINRPTGKLGIIIRAILQIATAPLALAGLLNAIFPILTYKKLLSLFKDKQFISSVRIVSGVFIIPFFFLLQFVLMGLICGNWLYALAYLTASPIVFYFGACWRKWWKMLMRRIKTVLFIGRRKIKLDGLNI